jgi:hypothetical protein
MLRDARASTRHDAHQAPPLVPTGHIAESVHALANRDVEAAARLQSDAAPLRGTPDRPAARGASDAAPARVPAASLAGVPEAHRTW